MKPVTNKLRVYHFPQVPCDAFFVEVPDEKTAKIVLNALSDQHLFLYEKNIIPDYSNSAGVEMFDGEDWVDYYNEEEGLDWDELDEYYLSK